MRTVVVTRPRAQAAQLVKMLRRCGSRVVLAPTIKIAPPPSYGPLDRAAKREYDCVVFTSVNGVERGFHRLKKMPKKLYAIGGKTASALRALGCRSVEVPETSVGEALARKVDGQRILIVRALKGREDLPRLLRKRGKVVHVAAAYRTVEDRSSAPRLRRLADAGKIDAVGFTSPSTARSLAAQLGRARWRALFEKAEAASIGPVTTKALRALGVRRVRQARRADDAALAEALS